jgi:hypothetical protein
METESAIYAAERRAFDTLRSEVFSIHSVSCLIFTHVVPGYSPSFLIAPERTNRGRARCYVRLC